MPIFDIIKQYLQDSDPKVRIAGLKTLTNPSFEEIESLLVEAIADPDQDVANVALDILRHHQPWLTLFTTPVFPVPDAVKTTEWGKRWSNLRMAISNWLQHEQENATTDQLWPTLERWLTLPGAIPDLVEELKAAGLTALADRLRTECDYDGCAPDRERQLLLAPTYQCNISCTYCYAKDWNDHFKASLSLEQFEPLFAWFKKERITSLVIGGGEPTVYQHFSELLKKAKDSGIRVYLTSNTLFTAEVRQYLHPEYISGYTAHYDQELLNDHDKHSLFMQNIQAVVAAGVMVSFRYTLTDQSDAAEWNKILDILDSLDIETMGYACAFRNYKDDNSALDFLSDDKSTETVKALESFVEACQARGVRLHLCKPFPFCALSPSTMRTMMLNGDIRRSCAAFLNNYTNNVTINPDLSTFPCNSIMDKGPAITDFSSLEEVGRYHKTRLKSLLQQPYIPECKECLFYYRGFCQGACLAEKHHLSQTDSAST